MLEYAPVSRSLHLWGTVWPFALVGDCLGLCIGLQISDTVYPMYKAYIEPDLKEAQLRIFNTFNPFSGFQSATYILKSAKPVTEEEIKEVLQVLSSCSPVPPVCSSFPADLSCRWSFYLLAPLPMRMPWSKAGVTWAG